MGKIPAKLMPNDQSIALNANLENLRKFCSLPLNKESLISLGQVIGFEVKRLNKFKF